MEEKELKSFDVIRWVIEDEETDLHKKVSKKKLNEIQHVCDSVDGNSLGKRQKSAGRPYDIPACRLPGCECRSASERCGGKR